MDYQCAMALERKENNSYITKTLTFPTSGPNLRDKQSEFRKNNFIFLILAYSGSCTCLYFQISSNINEITTSPQEIMLATNCNTPRCTSL